MNDGPSHLHRFIEHAVAWLVLVILMTYTYTKFFQVPYVGFRYEPDGRVIDVFVEASQNATVQVGDRLLRVGLVPFVDFKMDLRKTLFEGVRAAQTVELVVERNGQQLSIPWIIPGVNRDEVFERLNSQWWFAYVFWLAGGATLLLVRPKDTRWQLLIAFNFLTAIWLAAGSGLSQYHVWQSAIVLRAAVWLSVPVYLHLHWVFPGVLGRLPRLIPRIVYPTAIALAVAEGFQILPTDSYLLPFLSATAGSVALLVARVFLHPMQRRDVGLLAGAVAIILIPPIGIGVAGVFGIELPAFLAGGTLLAFPALPGAYFFVAYRRQLRGLQRRILRLPRVYFALVVLGTALMILLSLAKPRLDALGVSLSIGVSIALLAAIISIVSLAPLMVLPALAETVHTPSDRRGETEIRANRLLSLFLFVILIGLGSLLVIPGYMLFDFPGAPVLIGVGAAVLLALVASAGFPRFQRFVDYRILGIPLEPTHLLEAYAARITTSLALPNLVHILKDEILPSLLVRQSALLLLGEDGSATVVYEVGVEQASLPGTPEITVLVSEAGRYRPRQAGQDAPQLCPWTRLSLPLNVENRLVGLWLLGRRDPDDFYARAEIRILQALANQTAIALVNIDQAGRLRSLYRADIDEREAERTSLARELHDGVLHPLAEFVAKVETNHSPPGFQEIYNRLTTNIRRLIAGLRPATLDQGLGLALEELLDDLESRYRAGPVVRLDLQGNAAPHAPHAEQHLYRIVQQACENALQHASAQTIRIYGRLAADEVDLTVEDDGIGFATDVQLDLPKLLTRGHYGLAGIFERAALIGARLQIDAVPGRGTRVRVRWNPDDRQRAADGQ